MDNSDLWVNHRELNIGLTLRPADCPSLDIEIGPTNMNKSVWVIEEAVRLCPDGHPHKSSLLNNLGTLPFRRFEHLGLSDTNKFISVKEEAVRLTMMVILTSFRCPTTSAICF
jgi:hypothetical protein